MDLHALHVPARAFYILAHFRPQKLDVECSNVRLRGQQLFLLFSLIINAAFAGQDFQDIWHACCTRN